MGSRTYIGITIGPIGRVADMAKKGTRVLWATSYIFSYLARRIIEKFYLECQRHFVLPQWSKEGSGNLDKEVFDIKNGSGLFPDRYIFEAKDGDFEELKKHKDNVLNDLADKIRDAIGLEENECEKVREYVKKSFKVFFVEKSYDDNDRDVVKDISSMLDMLECEDLFLEEIADGENYLEIFFNKVESFLVEDAFVNNEEVADKRIIKTTFEYSACELQQKEYWGDFNIKCPGVDLVGKQGNPFKGNVEKAVRDKYLPYHNYIAVVKADGDFMSDTLKNMASKNISVYHLDHNLLQYNKAVGEFIRKQGGVPVFLGGDDLLFFAPVIGIEHKSVFELLGEINTEFNKHMGNLLKEGLSDDEMKLTLSFGVSISYYKFPIYEARKEAEELLAAAKDAGKNRLKWQLRKHSGQIISGGDINKAKNKFYKEYLKLIEDNVIITASREEDKLYSSFVYWLNEHKTIIKEIVSDNNKLINFFNNSFEKPIHNKAKFKEFYKKVFKMISDNHDDGQILETMYGVLRFILFVKNCE